MNHQGFLQVLLTGLCTLFSTACLQEPKSACRTSDDCQHPRVCVASICQDHYPDASPLEDRPSSDGSLSEVSVDSLDSAIATESTDGPAGEDAHDAWDVPQSTQVDGEIDAAENAKGDTNDANIPCDVPSGVDLPSKTGQDGGDALDGGFSLPSLWTLTGGELMSGPGVSPRGPGHDIDVFWRGADDHLKHRALLDEQTWSAEEDLGGILTAEPAATSRTNNIVDVFWRGPDDRLKHKWHVQNVGWSFEEDLGGKMASAPAAASWGTLALHVFWRGPDGLLRQKSLDYATDVWTDEIEVGIPVEGAPAAIYRNNGVMDLFWRGPAGTLLHVWTLDGMNWSGEQDLGRAIAADSSPTAASRQFEWVDVFWKGPDGRLKHVWMTPDDRWSLIEEDLGGELVGSPDATSWGLGRLDVFAKDAVTGQLAHLAWNHEATVTLNDADSRIDYSLGWKYSANRPFLNYRDDVHYTEVDGAYFEHRFTGTGIDYVTDYEASSGGVDIFIDGALQATVDCSGPTRMVQQVVYSKRGLASGSHTIKAVKKNGQFMVLDALRIHP